jgi:prolyl 4-hydroxylase
MAVWASRAASFSIGIGVTLLAVAAPRLDAFNDILPSRLTLNFHLDRLLSLPPRHSPDSIILNNTATCLPHNYTTQIVSLDPLVVYIHSFLHPSEIASLLAVGAPLLRPSTTDRHGKTDYRTSWSAFLSSDDPTVRCVTDRAHAFMGTMLVDGRDDIEAPQLVRYRNGQKFNLHRDWFERVRPARDGRQRASNRLASFFAILEANCTEGETYFPHLQPPTRPPWERGKAVAANPKTPWKEDEDGGLAFPPVQGNALFWVNLLPSGKGDPRVEHAGLPVGEGLKTAMNIWPRRWVGPDAWDESTREPAPEAK